MPITCEFQLNNPRAIYFTGKTFSGSIILTTTSDKDIRNIRIRFLGKAKVYWNNTRLYGRFISSSIASENYAYKCEETYVDQQVIARGKGTLLTGCHVFNFLFRIPKSCPSSHIGKYGEISYELLLTVDRPQHTNNIFSKLLTVARRVNLNSFPELKSPVSAEESYYPTCFTLASGKISFEFTLPFRGFASGQILLYSLQISNQSMIDISGYKLELVEAITYIAKHPYYKERKKRWVLTKAVFMDPCLRLTNRRFNRSLQLPSIALGCRNQCIIQWQHLLELQIIVSGCFGNKSVAIPIVIGSVPLIESVQEVCQENATPTTLHSTLQPISPTGPPVYMMDVPSCLPHSPEENNASHPPLYEELTPPSFDEAMITLFPVRNLEEMD